MLSSVPQPLDTWGLGNRLLASLLVKGADALLRHHLLRHDLFVFVCHLGSLFVVLVQDPL